MSEGKWLLRARKSTGMSRGQPEGALRTENLAGDQRNVAELVTACKGHQLKSDLSVRTCIPGHSRRVADKSLLFITYLL